MIVSINHNKKAVMNLMFIRKEKEMRRQIGRSITVMLMILAFSHILSASQIVLISSREMAENSALVLSGRVAGMESYWNEGHTKIFTRTTIIVDETYKGDHSPRIELIQLGGIVGNIKVNVEGALQWRDGDEVLLFLESYGSTPAYQVAGLSQGRFMIERDPETGERFVRRPAIEGVELLQADGGAAKGDGSVEKVTLDKFVSEVIEAK